MDEQIKKFKKRPLSWSSISSFQYDKEKWYKKYILGEEDPTSSEMAFGKLVADSFQTDSPLAPVRLYKVVEQKLSVIFDGIQLVGFIDTYDPITHNFKEFKTGKKDWDQKRANEHGQLKMYAMMLYITHKVKPEDYTIHLEWIPTQDNGDFSISFVEPIRVHSFKVELTMTDILKFTAHIRNVYGEMLDYIKSYPHITI